MIEIIRDVELHYTHLVDPQAPFGTAQWDLLIKTDSEETKTQLESLGLKPKADGDMWKVNVKRKTQSAKGEPLDPPVVVDSNKELMPEADVKSIGNGSKGNIKVFKYDWSVGGRSGTNAMLVAVQVTDYIKYEGGGGDVDF